MNRLQNQNQPIGRTRPTCARAVNTVNDQLIQDYKTVQDFNLDASLLFADGWNISHQVVFNGSLVVTYTKP